MIKRIFRSICLVAIVVFVATLVLIFGALYGYFSDLQQQQLQRQTDLVAQGLAHEGVDYLDGLTTDEYRVTWIAADGAVLYDSQLSAADLENHLERDEVRQALENGYGQSARYSDTLLQRSLYTAKRLPDGTVIRLSMEQRSVWNLALGMFQPILLVVLVAVVLSLILASRLAKDIVKPLNALDLDHPLANNGYEELDPLLHRIDHQQRQLQQQADTLRLKQEEWDTVTAGMTEGLVLLGDRQTVLNLNRAARHILKTDVSCIGKDILTVNRSPELRELLLRAGEGSREERLLPLDGGIYRLNATPVLSDEEVSGVVLLITDVTQREQAEQLRREFTANVSHELKTPLQTISGYAELLSSGMVKQEDIPDFSGRIYTEAKRMIRLVEDIIRLSRLDEGAEGMNRETVDLYSLAAETVASLQPSAAAASVTLKLRGQSATLLGVPQLLSGIIYNLCDNAIKYNRSGGEVEVSVDRTAQGVLLTVADTGIGIPAEHQPRVFERFYRVDKSHSKAVGGTGLGLSIVKHAVSVHGASLSLKSKVGQGTTITVTFPQH